jgi:hypothetical protein
MFCPLNDGSNLPGTGQPQKQHGVPAAGIERPLVDQSMLPGILAQDRQKVCLPFRLARDCRGLC